MQSEEEDDDEEPEPQFSQEQFQELNILPLDTPLENIDEGNCRSRSNHEATPQRPPESHRSS